jgi:hypothetical protein
LSAAVHSLCAAGLFTFEGREWEVVTEAAKDMILSMLVIDTKRRAVAKDLLQHRWFSVASTAPAAALGQHMVKRLRAFAGMSRMKRLALVVLARTLTDNDVKRLRVSHQFALPLQGEIISPGYFLTITIDHRLAALLTEITPISSPTLLLFGCGECVPKEHSSSWQGGPGV